MEPRGYKLCAKVTVTKVLYQTAPRARATHQTLLNARDQRNTGRNVNILDGNIYRSLKLTLTALKSLLIYIVFLYFRKKFKRSLTMTSLPLAFFKGCTSGNTDPNSPTSPIMTNGSGNVIGNNILTLQYNNETTTNFRCCLQFYQIY